MSKKYKTVLKRLSAIAMAAIMIFGIAPISELAGLDFSWLKAEAASNYNFNYTVKNNEVTINRLKLSQFSSSEIIVPATIEGYPVTAIGSYCFYGYNTEHSFIKKIELPSSIRIIGDNAFSNLVALESVNLPENLEVISYNLFSGCSSLKEIVIPKMVNTIGACAFSDCSSLTNLNIPESVKTIGVGAFLGCSSLTALSISGNVEKLGSGFAAFCTNIKEINVDPSNKLYKSVDGIVFNNSLKRLIQYPAGKSDLSYKIPNSVSQIGKSAFAGNKYISDISFNDSIERIYDLTFSGCENIRNITLPKNLESIYYGAFYNCKKLENVDFNIGLKSIGNLAFSGCKMLKNVTLPYTMDEAEDIGSYAFEGIHGLEIFISGEMHMYGYRDGDPFEADTIICGKEGSDAQKFAENFGYKFVAKHNPITKITLEHEDLTINRTSYAEEAVSLLGVNIEPIDFTEDINWKSSDESVVKIDGRSLGPESYGNGDYLYTKDTGTAIVKIYSKDANASCKVTVTEPVASINLPKEADVRLGESKYIEALVKPDNAFNKNLRWESSDPSIVKVNENTGEITGINKGEAVITAYSTDGTYEAQKPTYPTKPVDPMDPSGEYYEPQEPTPLNAKCTVKVIDPPHYISSTEGFESKHNYDNNVRDSWIYKSPGAENITLTFDSRTSLEEEFDFIYIIDKDGKEVGKYTGKELSGKSVKIMGDTAEVKLVADQSVNDWGFKVTDIRLNVAKKRPAMSGTKVYNCREGDNKFQLEVQTDSDGELTYTSSDTSVVKVDKNGFVEVVGKGKANITISSSQTNSFEAASMDVEVNVSEGLFIISEPQDFYGYPGDRAEFKVIAKGDAASYQWEYSKDGGETWHRTFMPGYSTNSIRPVLRENRSGQMFRCVITAKDGSWGIISEPAVMALKTSDITITSQPQNYSGKRFDPVRLHVEAQGENLTYRWLCSSDGGKTWKRTYLLGYNTDTLKVRLFKHRENTMYKCVITSAGENSVETTVATLTKSAK